MEIRRRYSASLLVGIRCGQQRKKPLPIPHSPFPICYLLFIICYLLFVSCATVPEASFTVENEGEELSLLPSGGRVYVWADVAQARPLLNVLSFEGMTARNAAQMIDSTRSAAAAVYGEAEGRRYYLAALGDFPKGKANFSFAFSRNWKKIKSPTKKNYWYSKKDNISLAMGSALALVSDADPWGNSLGEFQKQITPEKFPEFRRGMALAGWLPESSLFINGFLDSMEIPLQIPSEEFFFGVVRTPADKNPWELVFRIKTPSVSHARSLVSLFKLAKFFIGLGGQELKDELFSSEKGSMSPQEAVALLFANNPEQDAEYLTLRIDSLSESKIALLFDMFSVHSKQERQ